jgi:hypothetical protein
MGGGGHVELLWRRVEKGARKARRPHLAGAAFSKTYAEFSASAASSEMAHPLIVAEATAEHFGALMGPSVDHGARQYMRMAGLVKRAFSGPHAQRAWSTRAMRA